MKFSSLLTFLVALSVLVFSCRKKDTTPPPPPAKPNYEDSIKRDLWAFYKFDNGTFADSSGNKRDLRGANGISFGLDKEGKANNALSFDGVDDYAVIDAGNTLPEGSFTVSLSMYAQRTNGGRIFVKGNYANATGVASTFGFDDINQTNKLIFTINENGNLCTTPPLNSDLAYLYTDALIARNLWFSVIFSHSNGVEKIYLNGQLIGSRTTNTQSFKSCSNAPIYFGIWWLQNMFPFMGRMDNIRIYKRELNPDEIKYISSRYK